MTLTFFMKELAASSSLSSFHRGGEFIRVVVSCFVGVEMVAAEWVEGAGLFLLDTTVVGNESAGTEPLARSSGLRVTIRLIGLAEGRRERGIGLALEIANAARFIEFIYSHLNQRGRSRTRRRLFRRRKAVPPGQGHSRMGRCCRRPPASSPSHNSSYRSEAREELCPSACSACQRGRDDF